MPCYLVSVEELGVLLVVRVLTEGAGARQCPCVGCEGSVALSTADTHGGVLLAVQPGDTHLTSQYNNTTTHISHLRLCCCVGVHCTIQHCLVTHISHFRLCCCYLHPHWLIFPTCFMSRAERRTTQEHNYVHDEYEIFSKPENCNISLSLFPLVSWKSFFLLNIILRYVNWLLEISELGCERVLIVDIGTLQS